MLNSATKKIRITNKNIRKTKKINKKIADNKVQVNTTVQNIKQVELTKKDILFGVAKYFIFAVFFYVLNNAKIMIVLQPCFYGVFISLLFFCKNSFYLSLSYLISVLINGANISSLSFAIVVSIVGSILSYVHKVKLKSFKTYLITVYSFLLGLVYLILNATNLQQSYVAFINILLNTLCVLCSSVFLRVIKYRKLNLDLNIDEIVCVCVLMLFIFCGLQNLNVFVFDITKLFGIAVILFFSLTLPNSFSLIASIICGFGAMLVNNQTDYIVVFCLIAVLCCIFKNQHRLYTFLSVIIVEGLLYFFIFNSQIEFFIYMLPSVLVSVIYLMLPKTMISYVKQIFYNDGKNDALKNILNQNKLQLSKQLMYTSEVFYEMNKNFRSMVKGNLDVKTSKTIVCNEIIKQNCQNCSNKARCLKSFNTELKQVFEKLINIGFEKGKITLVDLPSYLTNRCIKTSTIINSFNSLLLEYKKYTKVLTDLDASKLLIADQLGGISYVLSTLAKEANEAVCQDDELQQRLKQNLIYENILPSEVVCFEKDYQTNEVALIIRNIDFDNSKIEKIISKTCGSKMILKNTLTVPNNSSLSCLFYTTAPTYDICVGVAQASKGGEDICGDTHSILKLSDSKFMLSLCDGMGHGKTANKASELCISLIENFYRAGFDNQTILTSVNSLLNMGKEEMFSAVDLSIIDLKSGEVDFIKQGATVGFIKNSKEINKIASNSLPMGILEKVKPKITKTVLSTEDVVIMLSDGIVDAFGEEEILADYLMSLPPKSPQELANAILKKAKLKQKNYPNDDMTVLVGKLFFNCA